MTAPPGPDEGKRPSPPRDAGVGRAFRRRAAKPVNASYSRMVQLAKVALPLAALGILALVAAWPSFVETTPPKLSTNPADSDLLQPRYFAVDEKGQPFSMVAKRAKEKDPVAGLVDLDEPEAEMTETGGAWVTLRANKGEYNRQTKILHLIGDVRILRDDGAEYRTEDAYTDIAAGTAWGDSYLVGQGPQGEVAGQGFRMSDRGKTMVFTNRAAVTTPSSAPPDSPRPDVHKADDQQADGPKTDVPRPAPPPPPVPSVPPAPTPIPPLPIPPIHAPPASLAPPPAEPPAPAVSIEQYPQAVPASPAAANQPGANQPGANQPGANQPGASQPGAPPVPALKPSVAPTAAPAAAPTGWTPPPPRRKPIPPKR